MPDSMDFTVELPSLPRVIFAEDRGPKGDPGPPGPPGSGRQVIVRPDSLDDWAPSHISSTATSEPMTVGTNAEGALMLTAPGSEPETPSRAMALYLPKTYRNVEVAATLLPPEVQGIASRLPQMGIALRVQDHPGGLTTGFVVDMNVFGHIYNEVWNNLWQWPTDGQGSLQQDTAKDSTVVAPKRALITGATRLNAGAWVDFLGINRMPVGWADLPPGDLVTVENATNPAYDQDGAQVVDAQPTATVVTAGSQGPAIDTASVIGGMTLDKIGEAPHPLSLYPMRMRARLVDDVLMVKAWPIGETEPGWLVVDHVAPEDSSGNPMTMPTEGRIGLLANHLEHDRTVAYTDIEIIDLGD